MAKSSVVHATFVVERTFNAFPTRGRGHGPRSPHVNPRWVFGRNQAFASSAALEA